MSINAGPATGTPASASSFARMQTLVAFISAVVGVVAAVQALASKSAADASAQDVQRFKQSMEVQSNLRAEKDSRARFDSVAYEAVVKVLELDRARVAPDVAEKRERAVLALVASTASESMQSALFAVLKSGVAVTTSVKKDAEQAYAVLQETGTLPTDAPLATAPVVNPGDTRASQVPSSLKGYRIVAFYCQNTAAPGVADVQRSAVEKLVAELRASDASRAADLSWEVKSLPEFLNASPGYGIRSNQIRFNALDGEEGASLELKSILEKTAVLRDLKVTLERRTVAQRTPKYLSFFLCGLQQRT